MSRVSASGTDTLDKDDRMHAAVFRSDLQTLASCNVSVKGEDAMSSRALTTSPHSYSATSYYKVNYCEDQKVNFPVRTEGLTIGPRLVGRVKSY